MKNKDFATCTLPRVPRADYKKLRILAAENETSINKLLLKIISDSVNKK